jgi:HlyD family secretion protein
LARALPYIRQKAFANMDKPISKSTQTRSRLRKALRWVLILGAVAALFLILRNLLKTRVEATDFQIAAIELGTIENTITASGLVVPAFEQQVISPISTSVKEVLLRSGDKVEKGDPMMLLDDEFIRLEYESLEDQYELKNNKITRLKYEYDKNIKDLDYENKIKNLQLSSLESQLADAQRLQEIGSATQEEVDQAKLNLEIAQLEKKKLENELAFSEQVLAGDKRNLELEARMEQKKLKELQRKLRETKVTAPRAGVITWISEDLGKTVNEGELLVRLADLGRYRVEASVSDRYAQYVKVGQPVRVRINRDDLTGFVAATLPAVENNTVSFIVELEQPDHKLLRPNMRVEVFLISDRREQALRLRNGPVFTGAARQNLFVVRGEEAIKTTARVGLVGIDYVELLETDLQKGDRVIISDMERFDHLERIQLQ